MQLPSKKELKEYADWKVPPPKLFSHAVEDSAEHPLSEKLIPGNPTNWRMEGHTLCYDTTFGPMKHTMPNDVIMVGLDKEGMPLLKRINV